MTKTLNTTLKKLDQREDQEKKLKTMQRGCQKSKMSLIRSIKGLGPEVYIQDYSNVVISISQQKLL